MPPNGWPPHGAETGRNGPSRRSPLPRATPLPLRRMIRRGHRSMRYSEGALNHLRWVCIDIMMPKPAISVTIDVPP